MVDSSDKRALWEQLVAHLQERAKASVNVLREKDSDLMIIGSNKEMTVTFDPDRSAVRWETANEYGLEKLQEPLSGLAVRLMQSFLLH